MRALANTTISILRGEVADEFGDAYPSGIRVSEGVPAFLIGMNQKYNTQDDPTPRIVRYYICRVGAYIDVRENDVIIDEATGLHYQVDGFTGNDESPAMKSDIRLNLKRIGGPA